jgi:hypothetical protein
MTTGVEARRAPSLPKDLPADLALVPADCVAFLTLRLRDLRDDALVSTFLGLAEIPILDERITRVPAEQVERITLVFLGPYSDAAIVRTRKPYDLDKLLNKLRPSFGPKDAFRKGEKGGPDKASPREPEPTRKTVNGKTILYKGELGPWTDGVCQVDRNVFAAGRVRLLERLVSAKARHSEELSDALSRAGKHTLVAWVQGEGVRALLAAELEGPFGPGDERRLEKGAPPPGKALPEKEKKPDADAGRKKPTDPLVPPELLPYKPLVMCRTALLTADTAPSLKASVRISFDDKADLDAAETALKTTLYVGSEIVGYLRRVPDLKPLAGLVPPVQKAIRSAKVERTEKSLRASASLSLDGAARKIIGVTLVETARLNKAKNNLKQLTLAMHNYHDTYGNLPTPAITDAKGKPLLSWRVAILPFIEQQHLYNQFKLDEPWDSPHNKKLLERMPSIYAPVGVKTKEPYSTFYQLCTGPNTPWLTISTRARIPANFPDGTSNTFFLVEAAEAVPWTKPVDLAIDPKKPLPSLGAQFKEVFLAGMADGSVRSLPRDLDAKILRWLIDPADGFPIPWDKIDRKR